MSESTEVFKDNILAALDLLLERKAPPRPGGEIQINHLRSKIEQESSIAESEILKALTCAGYDQDDIAFFFWKANILKGSDHLIALRDATRRVGLKAECD